jgi:predicted nucleic acid-binding protein
MILYLDATALARLFVTEAGSREVQAVARLAGICATSRIAYVECLAALARREREGAGAGPVQEVRDRFLTHWPEFMVVELGVGVLTRSGGYAREFGLGPCAAIHLASAVEVRETMPDLVFACLDEGLARAAESLGMRVVPGKEGGPVPRELGIS